MFVWLLRAWLFMYVHVCVCFIYVYLCVLVHGHVYFSFSRFHSQEKSSNMFVCTPVDPSHSHAPSFSMFGFLQSLNNYFIIILAPPTHTHPSLLYHDGYTASNVFSSFFFEVIASWHVNGIFIFISVYVYTCRSYQSALVGLYSTACTECLISSAVAV